MTIEVAALLGIERVIPWTGGRHQMKDRPHDEAMAKLFRTDLAYAVELLTDVRRNGDSGELAIILRQMEKAFGQDWSGVLPIQSATY